MFRKIVLPALVISGTFLAAFGAMIAAQGNKSIEVRTDSEQVFNGQLRDVFTPTMGVLLSAGIGLAAWTAIGCGYSLKKSNDLESEVSKLQKLITEREKQIQALKVEPSSPMMSQLRWFIDEEPTESQFSPDPRIQHPIQSTVTTVQAPIEPVGTATPGFDYQVIRDSQPAVKSAALAFPSAQTGLGLAQKQTGTQTSTKTK